MSEHYLPYDEDLAAHSLSPEHKEMFINEIKKVRQDAVVTEEMEKEMARIPMERRVENYNKMRAEIIAHMDKSKDPVFQEVLQYTRIHLTKEEFKAIEVEVYACSNKIAMQQCTPVDKIAHLAVWQDDPPANGGLQ